MSKLMGRLFGQHHDKEKATSAAATSTLKPPQGTHGASPQVTDSAGSGSAAAVSSKAARGTATDGAVDTSPDSGSTGLTPARSALPETHSSQISAKPSGLAAAEGGAAAPADLDARKHELDGVLSDVQGLPTAQETEQYNEQYNESLAGYDKQAWHKAMEKTELAEHEVARATVLGDEADHELHKANEYQQVVQKEAAEHDRLLALAEEQRQLTQRPDAVSNDVIAAQGELARTQDQQDRHRRAVQKAEAGVADREAKLKELDPALTTEDQALGNLAKQYDEAMREREAKHGEAERLQMQLRELDGSRSTLGNEATALEEKIRAAEAEIGQNETAFEEAKRNRSLLEEELQKTRVELERLTLIWQDVAAEVEICDQSVHGWNYKIAHLRDTIGAEEAEQRQLLELLEKLQAELEALTAELEQQRSLTDPDNKGIAEAEQAIAAKRSALEESEIKAKEAAARYKQLVAQADKEKVLAVEAAQEARQHADVYRKGMKEAQLHGDRHAQLWHEAQDAGDLGSHNATDAFAKLRLHLDQLKAHES